MTESWEQRRVQYLLEATTLAPTVKIAHHIRLEGGLHIPPRTIEDLELVLVTEGEGEYVLPEGSFRYGPGSLIVTPPHQRHAYRGGGRAMTHYALHLEPGPSWVANCLEGLRATAAAGGWEAFAREGRFQAVLKYRDGMAGAEVLIPPHTASFPDAARSLFDDAVSLRGEHKLEALASTALRLSSTVLSILALVVEACSAPPKRTQTRLARAAALIDERYGEDLSAADLAKEAGYAQNYFSGAFARAYGLSPMEYLVSRRVSQARLFLFSTTLPIKEIAFRCGFTDPYYFTKVFTKRTGLCPTRYRALARPDREVPTGEG